MENQISYHLIDNEIAVQVGDVVVRAKDESLTGAKRVMALMVKGGGVSFKDITLHSSDPRAAK